VELCIIERLEVYVYVTGVGRLVVVALDCAGEAGFGFVRLVINDCNSVFSIFTPEFDDE